MNHIKENPKSFQAEESILGAILLKGRPIYEKVAPWIRVDDAFYSEDNRKNWVGYTRLDWNNCNMLPLLHCNSWTLLVVSSS